MKVVVVGGGIAGLAAARALETLLPEAEIVLLERTHRVGGVLRTEHVDGFLVECGPDSFLSRKPRGVGLCEELGLEGELIARRPENARSFVRIGDELHSLPEGLTGLVPTDLDALERSTLLTPEGKRRLAEEADLPPAPPGEDESIASFVTRRLGREAYERLVEPLTTGIYGGDGERLSLQATFPQLRALELEHGSLLRGLRAQSPAEEATTPPFLSLRSGMEALARAVARDLGRTSIRRDAAAVSLRGGYAVELETGEVVQADGVVLATPAYVGAELVSELDPELAADLGEIPYAGSAIVTLGYRRDDVAHPLDGYGYVVPRSEESNVLACTWSSSKWEGRAPDGRVLLRVFAGVGRARGRRSLSSSRATRSRCSASAPSRCWRASTAGRAGCRSTPSATRSASSGSTRLSLVTRASRSPARRIEASASPTASTPARKPPARSPARSPPPAGDEPGETGHGPNRTPSYNL